MTTTTKATKATRNLRVRDEAGEEAGEVWSIRYRLHPLDVGFDLRAHNMLVVLGPEEPLRVSYADRDGGGHRVVEGPRAAVLRHLRQHGYRVRSARPGEVRP